MKKAGNLMRMYIITFASTEQEFMSPTQPIETASIYTTGEEFMTSEIDF
jgi:hypothetical protein